MGYITFYNMDAIIRNKFNLAEYDCNTDDLYGEDVCVDIDLDIADIFNELTIEDIIDHLDVYDDYELKELHSELNEILCSNDINTNVTAINCNTLDDEYKITALKNNMHKFTVQEIEDFFNGKN